MDLLLSSSTIIVVYSDDKNTSQITFDLNFNSFVAEQSVGLLIDFCIQQMEADDLTIFCLANRSTLLFTFAKTIPHSHTITISIRTVCVALLIGE